MLKVAVKDALSGYQYEIELPFDSKSCRLFAKIHKDYKISPQDQLIITKMGRIMRPNEPISQLLEIKGGDRTFAENYEETIENERLPGVYLISRKEMQKEEGEKQLKKSKAYWIELLKQEAIVFIPNVEFRSYEYPSRLHEVPQAWQQMKPRVQGVNNAFQKLKGEYLSLKGSMTLIKSLASKCSNQKKLSSTLKRTIHNELMTFNKQVGLVKKLFESIKNGPTFDDVSLREDSSCFSRKRMSDAHLSSLEQQQERVCANMTKISDQFKSEKKKQWTVIFRQVDILLKWVKDGLWQQQLVKPFEAHQQQFGMIFSQFTLAIQRNDAASFRTVEKMVNQLKEIIEKQLLPQYEKSYSEFVDKFIEYNEANQKYTGCVKVIYKDFIGFFNTIRGQIGRLQKIKKQLRNELQNRQRQRQRAVTNKQNNDLSEFFDKVTELSTAAQDELRRRIVFNKKMNFMVSLGDKMVAEQEKRRKKFVQESPCDVPFLKDSRTPTLQIDLQNTTDPQVIKEMRQRKIDLNDFTTEEFMTAQYNEVMKMIREAVGAELSPKLKNMEEIVVRMGSVFSRVYNAKIEKMIEEKELLQAALNQMREVDTAGQKDQEQRQQLQCQIAELTEKLAEKQQTLLRRERERSEEMNKERAKNDKLKQDYKRVEKDLNHQIQMSEQLIQQFAQNEEDLRRLMEQNQQLKGLLANKEIQVIRLEEQLNQTKVLSTEIQSSQSMPIAIGIDLKNQVIVQDLSGEVMKAEDGKLEQLRKEIELLQMENQELQEQNTALNQQMRTIIMKQTEDYETQTENLNSSINCKPSIQVDSITITPTISIGQRVIFMPFSGSCYVAITQCHQDKTISNNMNPTQPSNYFLDLNQQPNMVRQLLTECSFIAVVKVSLLKNQGAVCLVEGSIEGLYGFEDDSPDLKNYAGRLPLPAHIQR